ncbi:MAG: hypothetical protein K6V97_07460 [Actinomycetia bacterium]|nr:hypothetical protein [Actinomycetes bacterium]
MARVMAGALAAVVLLALAAWLLHLLVGGLVLTAALLALLAATGIRGAHPVWAAVLGTAAALVLLRFVLGFWLGLWPWLLVALGIWGLTRLLGGALRPRHHRSDR